MRYQGDVKQNALPMNCNNTLNYAESIYDRNLFSDIKAAFAEESKGQSPSRCVIQYLKAFAAAYKSVDTGLMGRVSLMSN